MTRFGSSICTGEYRMNKYQVQGTFRNLAGKVQEEVGRLLGSEEQQRKGMDMQASAKAERRLGDIQHCIREADALAKTVADHPRRGM